MIRRLQSWPHWKGGIKLTQIERRLVELEDLEIRADEGQPVIVKGYAARFEKLSVPLWGFKEKIRAGAFAESLKSNRTIKALWNHNSDFPLGSTKNGTLTLAEDEKGLRFEFTPPDTSWGKDAIESIKRGDVDGVSFGFRVRKDEWDETDPKNIVRTLIDVDLIEISPTPFPAYPSTSASVRSFREVYESHVAEGGQAAPDATEIDGQEDQDVQARMDVYLAELELLKES